MAVVEFMFKMIGKGELLLHRDSIEYADYVEAWRLDRKNNKKQGSKKGDDRSPAWTWLGALHWDDRPTERGGTGEVGIPSYCITSMLAAAGTQIILKGNKTYKEAAAAAVFPMLDYYPLTVNGRPIDAAALIASLGKEESFAKHVERVKQEGFNLDVRRAKAGASRHIRVRPCFVDWKVAGEVRVDTERVPENVLAEIFEIMGERGLGDFRPSSGKPGRYGMFKVVLEPIGARPVGGNGKPKQKPALV